MDEEQEFGLALADDLFESRDKRDPDYQVNIPYNVKCCEAAVGRGGAQFL